MIIDVQEESARDQNVTANRSTTVSVFNELADQYDAWFDEQGKVVSNIEVCALKSVLAYLPKPWLEIGVGSGRFAQALGIKMGIDPSKKLLEMASKRGINVFLGLGGRTAL